MGNNHYLVRVSPGLRGCFAGQRTTAPEKTGRNGHTPGINDHGFCMQGLKHVSIPSGSNPSDPEKLLSSNSERGVTHRDEDEGCLCGPGIRSFGENLVNMHVLTNTISDSLAEGSGRGLSLVRTSRGAVTLEQVNEACVLGNAPLANDHLLHCCTQQRTSWDKKDR